MEKLFCPEIKHLKDFYKLRNGYNNSKDIISISQDEGSSILEDIPIYLTSLECRRRTLDDLFMAMSGRHLDD